MNLVGTEAERDFFFSWEVLSKSVFYIPHTFHVLHAGGAW